MTGTTLEVRQLELQTISQFTSFVHLVHLFNLYLICLLLYKQRVPTSIALRDIIDNAYKILSITPHSKNPLNCICYVITILATLIRFPDLKTFWERGDTNNIRVKKDI